MPKQIVSDTFENLAGIAKSTGQQVVEDVKRAGEDIAIELGVKPAWLVSESKTTQSDFAEEQTKRIETIAKKRATARYREIQAEIKALEEKRSEEMQKRFTEKPTTDENNKIKQLEVEEKKRLPPLPVQRASQKTEIFRGTSG